MRLSGDNLGVADPRKFEKVKLLRFKHRDRIMIDHMDVELMVRDSRLDLFPFMFDIDRYRFGVEWLNDLGLNPRLPYRRAQIAYTVSFRSQHQGAPRPCGRFSLGRAHLTRRKFMRSGELTDTTRINLIRRSKRCSASVCSGKRNARLQHIERPDKAVSVLVSDTLRCSAYTGGSLDRACNFRKQHAEMALTMPITSIIFNSVFPSFRGQFALWARGGCFML